MSAHRQPSRLALAVFDRCVPGNEPLRGDLIEEFEGGRSQWWLWWQVTGAVLYQRPSFHLPTAARAQVAVVGAALVVLMCFEAVFATNIVYRIAFGPPMADIVGSAYGLHRAEPIGFSMPLPLGSLYAALAGAIVALPFGWIVGRFHREHHQLSMATFAIGTHLWAVVNMRLPLAAQFLSMLLLIVGMLLAARMTSTAHWSGSEGRSRSVRL